MSAATPQRTGVGERVGLALVARVAVIVAVRSGHPMTSRPGPQGVPTIENRKRRGVQLHVARSVPSDP
jgi:hypothetical protein